MNIEELSNLSDDDLRVKCAALCGWEIIEQDIGFHAEEKFGKFPCVIYDYPADLNAMHEAENVLPSLEQKADYICTLANLVDMMDAYNWWETADGCARLLCATARQRCIAFIATMTATDVERQPSASNEAA